MNYWDAIVLGIVEGLTEFLPVSSTFHLIAAARLLGSGDGEFTKLFNVFIQSGAILAVLFVFWKRLRKDRALVTKTLAAFLPTMALGILAYRTIKDVFFDSSTWMIGIFILVGFVFLVFERLVKGGTLSPRKALTELTYRDAVLAGLAQCLAFFPGVSRAGAVILMMMVLGFRRDDAAAFSFFLAVPTILAAGAYDLYKTKEMLIQSVSYIPVLAVGFLAAFAIAAFALKWLIRYLQTHTLNLFGFYRIAAGVLLILAFLFL
ncbi:MAG: undecaprenyl-diphosphate phosphatase [Candidatus Aminicenantales bacterium]